MKTDEDVQLRPDRGTVAEVFSAFLRLGLTSFGGPVAHLGYFRDDLVLRRRWIDERGYGDLVALCQFLPGPASSQVGFALGLLRAGPLGGLAAWAAFTLPSAIILIVCALAATSLDSAVGQTLIHGLKLVAVAVVGQAVWGMARSLAPDRTRAGIALAALFVATVSGPLGQILAIGIGGLGGLLLCREARAETHAGLNFAIGRSAGLVCLGLFVLLLLVLPLLSVLTGWQDVALFDGFYRAGALVFGGGHVVLPLLEAEVVGRNWVSAGDFLAGYGLAQAVPGPLFTFAAYLGAMAGPAPHGIAGAAIALVAIFLPGFLLLVAALPFAGLLGRQPLAQAAMRGANAAVVGILAAALYTPVWTGAVFTPADFMLVAAGFLLLVLWKLPSWAVVLLMVCVALIWR